jgi:hypothetical protein
MTDHEKCYEKGCANAGVHYRDRTITGIGDIRFYCDDHVSAADTQHKKQDWQRKITWLKSNVAVTEKAYLEAKQRHVDELSRYERAYHD